MSDNEKSFNLELSLDTDTEPQCTSSQIPCHGTSNEEPQSTLNPQNWLKNMIRRKQYAKKKEFDSLIDLDDFIRSKSQYPLKITHNTKVNCTLCDNHDCHKMTQMYRKCQCKKDGCDLAYKINNCTNSSIWILSETGIHPTPIEDVGVNVRANGKRPIKRHGIALRIQEIYSKWLKKDDLITAKRLLSKLVNRRKENLAKAEKDQSKKYIFSNNIIPSLKQVFLF